MRRAHKVDKSQAPIMKALRDSGMKVFDCSAVGQGFPDLCASFRGGNYLLETKSHKNVSHRVAQPLTVAQIAFHNTWAGDIGIVETPEQAVAWVIAQAAREGRL